MRTLTLLCCVICIVAAGVGYWQPASAIAAAVFRVCLALLVSRAALNRSNDFGVFGRLRR